MKEVYANEYNKYIEISNNRNIMTVGKAIKCIISYVATRWPVSFSGVASIANSKSSRRFKNADEQKMA